MGSFLFLHVDAVEAAVEYLRERLEHHHLCQPLPPQGDLLQPASARTILIERNGGADEGVHGGRTEYLGDTSHRSR